MKPIHLPNDRLTTKPIPLRSSGSTKVEFVTHGENGPLIRGCDSYEEFKTWALLLAKRDVVSLWDQPPQIEYECPETQKGRIKHPDGLLTMASGHKIVVEVKDAEKANCPKFLRQMDALSEAIPEDYADELCVISSDCYESHEATNAMRFMECSRQPDCEADTIVADFASNLDGLITIGDAVEILNLDGRAFPAIFRAIYHGIFKQIEDGIIDLTTIIEAGA